MDRRPGTCTGSRHKLLPNPPPPRHHPAIQPQAPTTLIGYIGRRGRLHRIEDIMDPNYRAASNDPVLCDFNPLEMRPKRDSDGKRE